MSNNIDNFKIDNDKISSINPINRANVKRKKINGQWVYERFYPINFFGIKENSYVISSFGRVFSLIKNKELKPNVDTKRNNYTCVTLCMENGKGKKFPIHALVAAAFIPRSNSDIRLNRTSVHHKNWDNDYNYFWNLEYRSPMEIVYMGRIQDNKDLEDDEIIKIICKLLELKIPIVEIFDIIDRRMSKDTISKIKNKKIFTFISDDYNF